MLPPMSDPTPITAPAAPSMLPSPPEVTGQEEKEIEVIHNVDYKSCQKGLLAVYSVETKGFILFFHVNQ